MPITPRTESPKNAYATIDESEKRPKDVEGETDVFAGRLLGEWWETHSSAGPPEGLAKLTGPPLGKPPLRVCTWQGDVPVVMPEVAGKFAPGREAADQWQGEVTAFETKPVGEAREALLPCLLEDDCAMIIGTPDGPGDGAPDDGQQKYVMPLATAIF